VLQGKKIKATFIFMNNDDILGTDDNEIVDYKIDTIDEFNV
jgi:hypothetical protein